MMTSIFQYDQEAHEAAPKEDGYDEGYHARHDELESEIANLTLTVSVQETTISDQEATIVSQEATISELEKANQELHRRLKEYESNL